MRCQNLRVEDGLVQLNWVVLREQQPQILQRLGEEVTIHCRDGVNQLSFPVTMSASCYSTYLGAEFDIGGFSIAMLLRAEYPMLVFITFSMDWKISHPRSRQTGFFVTFHMMYMLSRVYNNETRRDQHGRRNPATLWGIDSPRVSNGTQHWRNSNPLAERPGHHT